MPFNFLGQRTQLSVIHFLSDGEHIAIASEDGNIYVQAVYDEGTTYRRVGRCSVSSLLNYHYLYFA